MTATPSDRRRGGPADAAAKRSVSGFLGALRRDARGNTLAMMAAFLVPLTALAGSAVDMSRAYLVRVRLQQACDAGVLAGRKLMTVTSGTTLDNASTTPSKPAETQARAFFNNNFPSGWMQTTSVAFTPSRMSDGQVAATATATMPMAIMRMFGFNSTTQSVTCNARLDVGDTDIMFVLDTTGSMACVTGSGCSTITTYTREDGTTDYYRVEQSGSKIAGLRTAVETFYNTLKANAPSTAHIRYGFVPYASSVNVGSIIKAKDSNYLVNSVTYQSRELATDLYGTSTSSTSTTKPTNPYVAVSNINDGDVNYGTAPTPVTTTGTDQTTCRNKETRKSGTVNYAVGTWPTSGTVTRVLPVWSSASSGTCSTYAWTVKPLWRYKPVSIDVSSYKNSLGGTAVANPTKITGQTDNWQGCIEERDTTASTSFTQGSLPGDLDPDLVPTSDATRWRPMWPEAIYYRPSTSTALYAGSSSTSSSSETTSTSAGADYTSPSASFAMTSNYYACGKAAQRLQEMTLAQVQTYVSATGDFRALGYTYHDVGMIWGLRLLSPTGIWKDDTAAWPGNNPPNRYIVFMSDGALQTLDESYYTYGVELLDKRVTGSTLSNNDANHNARFQAVCSAAKNMNITIFVVAFDTSLTTDMTNCATPGFAYTASNTTALNTAFANIALQVAKLRLSQ